MFNVIVIMIAGCITGMLIWKFVTSQKVNVAPKPKTFSGNSHQRRVARRAHERSQLHGIEKYFIALKKRI